MKSEPNKDAKPGPDDGALHFLLGQCQEKLDDPSGAEKSYRDAIEYKAPQHVEASSRLAALLLNQLKKPTEEEKKAAKKEADGVIDAMVNSEPENYQVYLQRGPIIVCSVIPPRKLKTARKIC